MAGVDAAPHDAARGTERVHEGLEIPGMNSHGGSELDGGETTRAGEAPNRALADSQAVGDLVEREELRHSLIIDGVALVSQGWPLLAAAGREFEELS